MARENPYKRIVLKFGTSLLTGGADHLSREVMGSLTSQVATLHARGLELIIVTSGAVAAGREKLGTLRRVKGIPVKQMLASVGQSRLMAVYTGLFEAHDIIVAQALLTKRDLMDRAGYLNTRNTLLGLIERGVIPIINENDVVSADEIHDLKFGDNDNLSAMVASLIDADLLVILSDINGLYTADPHKDPTATLIPEVSNIDAEIEKLGSDTSSASGTGGMITKIEAAKLATSGGCLMVIADGREPDILSRVLVGSAICTRFLPATSKLESRKRWMLSGLGIRGKVVIDSGAAEALTQKNRSLLATGIKDVSGSFNRGEVIEIATMDGAKVGTGIANYSAEDIGVIKGKHSEEIAPLLGYDYGDEVVHRNNLVIV
jgi:glutamate 5-kinase